MKAMFQRTSFLLSIALILTTLGVVLTVTMGPTIGIIVLQVTLFLVLAILLLQRRQTAKLQARLLSLIKSTRMSAQPVSDVENIQRKLLKQQRSIEKRLVNMLQAQQISMENLAKRVDVGEKKVSGNRDD